MINLLDETEEGGEIIRWHLWCGCGHAFSYFLPGNEFVLLGAIVKCPKCGFEITVGGILVGKPEIIVE